MCTILDLISRYPHATDIHLTEGERIRVRSHGMLLPADGDGAELMAGILAGLSEEKQAELCERGACDSAFSAGTCRCRLHVYQAIGKKAAAIRILPSLADLPPDPDGPWMDMVAGFRAGLVLVTGPTGSGKSTTLAHLICRISQRHACHIVTIEDPAEYIFPSGASLIHQREVGTDVTSFAAGVREALREDPDVLVIGEMRDQDTISAALTAAETGHLVLATMHNRRAMDAIGRIVHAFPGEKETEIRSLIASVLRTAAAQTLYQSGTDTLLLREILTNIPAISHLIREGKDAQIAGYMEMGTRHMRTMKQSATRASYEEKMNYETKEKLLSFVEDG